MRRCVIYEHKQTLEKSCASAEIYTKEHTAILFSLLLFLMLPVTFVHAQRLYTTDGVNVRAKPNSSSKVLTSVSAGTSVTKTGRSGNWIAVRVRHKRLYLQILSVWK